VIETQYFWLNVFFLSLGTIAIRGSIIAISHRAVISDRIKELFSFIPAAILPAFVAPAVFFHEGHVQWALGKERLLILILAVVVCYWLRSTLVTVCFGLIALWLVSLNL